MDYLWGFLALAGFALLSGAWLRLLLRAASSRRNSRRPCKVIPIDTYRQTKEPISASRTR